MLDYKSIIIKRYALGLSYSELANVRGKVILQPHGKEFFTWYSKHLFTLHGKHFFT